MSVLQNKIDVAIASASRPKLLPYLVDSFNKYIFFHGKFNGMLNEDFVYDNESNRVLEFCKKRNIKSFHHKPAKGIGNAIQLLLNKSDSDYIFILQDDWEFELPIDLSHILYTMDKNLHINCVAMSKRRNLRTVHGYRFIEEEYNGLRMCLSNIWPLFNGIGRKSFIKKHWSVVKKGKTQEAHWNGLLKKGMNGKNDYDFLRDNIGSYVYGPLGYPRTIRHLGYTWSVKPRGEWSIKKDGYGGNAMHDLTGGPAQMRAPGLPPEEERPMYLENKKDLIKEYKEKNV